MQHVLRNVADLSCLATLGDARELYLSLVGGVTDLAPLAGLTQLTTVALNGSPVRDVTPLLGSRLRIENLYLDKTLVEDLTPLRRFARLKHLDIRKTPVSYEGYCEFVDDLHLHATIKTDHPV